MAWTRAERIETVVIGGGQAGLSVGYHLSRLQRPFLILEARDRVGDAWRDRWDSLRLFTPAKYSSLDGMPFPAPAFSFPTKDAMADYLEAYADKFSLPVRTGTRVVRLSYEDGEYHVDCGERSFSAENVVVAMADFQQPRVPSFASKLDSSIVQLHSSEYRNPKQLREGNVLIVGAGNSGSDIAVELAPGHDVWLSGRHPGQLPFHIEGRVARMGLIRLVLRGLFHRVLTLDTPVGRRSRPIMLSKSGPLIRVKRSDLDARRVRRVPRTVDVRDGRPVLADGRPLNVSNVIWCTGYHPGFDWIDVAGFDPTALASRLRVNDRLPGLFFVGLLFLHARSSDMIHGVGRDAGFVAKTISERAKSRKRIAGAAKMAADLAPLSRVGSARH